MIDLKGGTSRAFEDTGTVKWMIVEGSSCYGSEVCQSCKGSGNT